MHCVHFLSQHIFLNDKVVPTSIFNLIWYMIEKTSLETHGSQNIYVFKSIL